MSTNTLKTNNMNKEIEKRKDELLVELKKNVPHQIFSKLFIKFIFIDLFYSAENLNFYIYEPNHVNVDLLKW